MKEKKTNTNPRRGFFFVVARCQSNAVTELVEVPAVHTLIPVCTFKEGVEVENVLTNSFGFGGNCSSLIFTR